MIIDVIADLHGYYPTLKGGDLLLLCGDYTSRDNLSEWAAFFHWLKMQDYEKKILIAGNHDNFMDIGFPKSADEVEKLTEVRELIDEVDIDFEYLCDSGTEFGGLKIWGSPWSVWFDGVNPKCKAFMKRESKLECKFKQIPKDVDILLTHTPPYLILDQNRHGLPCGSMALRYELDTRIKPKLHFFGHIHEQHGKNCILKRKGIGTENNTKCFNVSYVNEDYRPFSKTIRIEL